MELWPRMCADKCTVCGWRELNVRHDKNSKLPLSLHASGLQTVSGMSLLQRETRCVWHQMKIIANVSHSASYHDVSKRSYVRGQKEERTCASTSSWLRLLGSLWCLSQDSVGHLPAVELSGPTRNCFMFLKQTVFGNRCYILPLIWI